MAYEDPVVKEIREKKDDILRNTDKIISLLSKKKTELNGKVLEELLEHEDMLKQVLEIINSKDKNKIVSKKQLISSKNLPKPPPA
jgi:L-lactate utilization protein LutB